jgi:hypothetical protein
MTLVKLEWRARKLLNLNIRIIPKLVERFFPLHVWCRRDLFHFQSSLLTSCRAAFIFDDVR